MSCEPPSDARSRYPAAHPDRNSERRSDDVTDVARDPIDVQPLGEDEEDRECEDESDDAAELRHIWSVGRCDEAFKSPGQRLMRRKLSRGAEIRTRDL